MFFKVGFLKTSGKYLCWSPFIIKFQVLRHFFRTSDLKNIWKRLLLNERYWYSTNEIWSFTTYSLSTLPMVASALYQYLSKQTNTCSKSAKEILEITENNSNENDRCFPVKFAKFLRTRPNFSENVRPTASDIRMDVQL